MIDKLLNSIAPHYCYNCGKIGGLLCDSCKYNIINAGFNGCVVCGLPTLRGVCNDHAYTYKSAYVVGERKDALQYIIDDYKFQRLRSAYIILADLINQTLPELPDDIIVTTIPTSKPHVRQRGYDHTLLISKRLAKLRKLQFQKTLVHKEGVSQHFLSRAERRIHAESAFEIDTYIRPGANYLIIDDIFTTGSTIESASRILNKAGANHISIAVIARQPLSLF